MEEKMNCTVFRDKNYYGIIGFMQAVTALTKSTYVLVASCKDEIFDEAVSILRASDEEILKAHFTDEMLFNYRTVNGKPLKGLLGSGKDAVEVDFKTLPDDHMIPEVIEAQRNYVVHRTVAKFRRKVFMTTNRDMTSMEVNSMTPDELQRMSRLIDALLDGTTPEELAEYTNGDESVKVRWMSPKQRIDRAIAESKLQ